MKSANRGLEGVNSGDWPGGSVPDSRIRRLSWHADLPDDLLAGSHISYPVLVHVVNAAFCFCLAFLSKGRARFSICIRFLCIVQDFHDDDRAPGL